MGSRYPNCQIKKKRRINNEQQTSIGRNRFHRSADDSFYYLEAVRHYHMVMVVGAVSAMDINDIMGDFSGHRITCRRVEMKGFIEVTTENGTHLLNMKYIEDVWEDEDEECTIYLAFNAPDAVKQDYILPYESYDEVKKKIEEATK